MATATESATLRVEMTTNTAGRPAYQNGQILDLPVEQAREWIKEGYCRLVRTDAPEKATRA